DDLLPPLGRLPHDEPLLLTPEGGAQHAVRVLVVAQGLDVLEDVDRVGEIPEQVEQPLPGQAAVRQLGGPLEILEGLLDGERLRRHLPPRGTGRSRILRRRPASGLGPAGVCARGRPAVLRPWSQRNPSLSSPKSVRRVPPWPRKAPKTRDEQLGHL